VREGAQTPAFRDKHVEIPQVSSTEQSEKGTSSKGNSPKPKSRELSPMIKVA